MWYLDVPNCHDDPENANYAFVNVFSSPDRELVMQKAKEWYGADDDGKVTIVTGNDEEGRV